MPINWQDGSSGGTPLSAANLNRLAVTADIGTAGTPTGDAVKAAAAAVTKSADTITDGTTNKAYTATERTKLAGVAAGANLYTDTQAQSANASSLAAKANIADIGTTGTPTGDALKAAFDAWLAAAGGVTPTATYALLTEAGDTLTTEAGDVLVFA